MLQGRHARDVPYTVDGRPTVLVRVDDRLRKFPAACLHARGPRAPGRTWNNRLVCPWRGAAFDLATGKRTAGAVCADLPAPG